MIKKMFFVLGFIALIFSDALQANDSPKKLGEFGAWKAYEMKDKDGQKVYYMLSEPTSSKGKYTKRGDVYALITHRPGKKSFNVVSLHAGYSFKDGAQVIATVKSGKNTKDFKLFTDKETAWTPSDQEDKNFTKNLTEWGSTLEIKGESLRGTKTVDEYSLKGSLAAYRAICKACGYKA